MLLKTTKAAVIREFRSLLKIEGRVVLVIAKA